MKPKEKIQALALLNEQIRKERGLDDKDKVTINIALLNDAYERAVSMLDIDAVSLTKKDKEKFLEGEIVN